MSANWRDNGGSGDEGFEGAGGAEYEPQELMSWDALGHTSTKDIVLFLVDAGPHMHKINPDTGCSFLSSALFNACKLYESKLITSPKDQIGFMLFGTACPSEEAGLRPVLNKGKAYSKCVLLEKVGQVDLVQVAEIYDLLAADERGFVKLTDCILTAPFRGLFRIEHALANAVNYLAQMGKVGYKRIFFMTNNDDPTVVREDVTVPFKSSNPSEERQYQTNRSRIVGECLKYVKQANDRNIELEPLFISTTRHNFDVDRFYGDVFAAYDNDLSSDEGSSSDSDVDSDSSSSSSSEDSMMAQMNPNQKERNQMKTEKRVLKLARATRREQRESRNRKLYDCTTKMDTILSSLEDRQMPKRVVFSTTMEIGDGIHIGVKGYAMFMTATRGTPARVLRVNGDFREIAVKQVPVCQDTHAILKPKQDTETAFAFGATTTAASLNEAYIANAEARAEGRFPPQAGSSRMPAFGQTDEDGPARAPFDMSSLRGSGSAGRGLAQFSKDELRELREVGVPYGIRVLGFKPQAQLHDWMSIKHATFLYPTDEMWKGSKRFFASLLSSMLKKNVFALALCLPRANSIPTFAALWPREEKVDEEGTQLEAPGMMMIPLPYADDMRDCPVNRGMKAGPKEVKLARKLVSTYSLSEPFHFDAFPNPFLKHHYATIKAIAFNRDLPPTSLIGKAKTKAEEEAAEKRRAQKGKDRMDVDGKEGEGDDEDSKAHDGPAATLLDMLKNPEVLQDVTEPDYSLIQEFEEDRHYVRRFNDQIASGGYDRLKGAMVKFRKKNEPELREKWQAKKLATYKNDDLKAILAYYRLPTTGVKAELAGRLEKHLNLLWTGRSGGDESDDGSVGSSSD
ncbi:ATP-dependent DNA helicase II subunit 1 [Tilletia horrida]|nr:ATP-dependent DNA helicase II subunit 1 [Tilletia horrida]KAK0569082.1 ATP-dependent DNA helicase II subunit 1 [Tilletia horrida]